MNRQHHRSRARTLSAVLGTGLLTLALTACGGADEDGTAAPTESGPATSDASPTTTSDASPTVASPTAPGGEPTDAASGSPTGAPGEVETALVAVLGEEADIVTGDQLKELTESARGLAENMTVTPEECGQAGQGAATGELPEDADLIGGILVDTTDVTAPTSDLLSVTTYADAAQAAEALTGYGDFAERCSSYTVELGDAMTADATLEVIDIDADADAALAMAIDTTVGIEGVELPEGTETTTSTTLYVVDGERLITYAGSGGGGEAIPVEKGLDLVDALRAELDG